MRILIVASYNSGKFAPFILEQVKHLEQANHTISFFGIVGKGFIGYVHMFPSLIKKIRQFKPDIIHAHYGLSGLLANLQRKIPVVTTYHGSDINNKSVLPFSKLAMRLSAFNIFVSQKNIDIAKIRHNYQLIPCGVDLDVFYPINKKEARKIMNLEDKKKYVLFSSHFNNQVKNPQLAIDSVAICQDDVELLELKGYERQEVNLLMNAVDCVLMTSHTEGSPQFIKEAMAVNCPIVSVDVGDVKDNILGVDNCSIAERNKLDISKKITFSINVNNRLNSSRKVIDLKFNNKVISHKLIVIYSKILHR